MSLAFILSHVALWALVAFNTLILLGVVRALYELRQGDLVAESSLKGLPAPSFSAVDLSGRPVSTATLAGKPAVLLFVSPTCPSCMVTLAELKALASNPKRGLVVICQASDNACQQLAENYRLTVPVVADEDGELMQRFGVSGPPMGVRITADSVIESHGEPVRGTDVERFLAEPPQTKEATDGQIDDEKAAV